MEVSTIEDFLGALRDPSHPLHQKVLHLIEEGMQQECKALLETIEAMYPELKQVYWEGKEWQALKVKFTKEVTNESKK